MLAQHLERAGGHAVGGDEHGVRVGAAAEERGHGVESVSVAGCCVREAVYGHRIRAFRSPHGASLRTSAGVGTRQYGTRQCGTRQYASTIFTSSSVTSPSTILKERNWNSPSPSVSAVETRT